MSCFISRLIGEGIYQITSDEYGSSFDFGKPSASSYLIIGEEKAVLIDLAVNIDHIENYIRTLTDRDLMVVLTHAHPDHIYHMNRFRDIYLHYNDRRFPLCFLMPWSKKPKLHFIDEKSVIELGGRQLNIFHVPGHTMGSILLYDSHSGYLFSGDTIARRLLYGLCGKTEINDFISNLQKIRLFNPIAIYSCHDRHALNTTYIDFMTDAIVHQLPYCTKTWKIPFFPKMVNLVTGNENESEFFDIAVDMNTFKKLSDRH